MILKCDTTRLLNGRMSRLINFLGNFIIVVLFHAASSLSPPTNSFEMLFFFSLSSIILDKRTLPYFVSKLSIFWFPPKGMKGIRVVFELFQFQSLHQRCIQFNRDRSCFVTKGGEKKRNKKLVYRKQQWSKSRSPRWKKGGNFRICFNPVGRETQLTVRQFGEVSGAAKDRLAERRWTLEARGTVFASCLHYHTYCVAIANQASSAARFSHFHEETRCIQDPNGE